MNLGLDQLSGQIEKLAKLPKPYRMALLPAIAVVVCAVYVYFLYLPAATQLEGLRNQELQLQRRLNEVRSVASNIMKFEEEIAALERKLSIALRQLPDSKELPVLLTDITTLGKTSGLEVQAFRPSPEIKRDFYAEVPIEIEFTGRFHDIALFFDEISRLPRIVNVSELDISIGDETSVETMLKVKGEATTFRFLENEELPAPEAGAKKGAAARARGKG